MDQESEIDCCIDHKKRHKKSRKIMKIKSSKFESAAAIHRNKEFWHSIFDEMDAATSETIEESKRIAKVLPNNLYVKVCSTLNLPVVNIEDENKTDMKEIAARRIIKEPMLSYKKCLYIDREADSDTDVEFAASEDEGYEELDIHKQLLSKPEREQVTWDTHYLQPEREEDKTLIRKADDLTDRIATEFCKFMKELGGSQQSNLFTPKAIKELFQIEFDTHVARALRVVPKEIPCIQEKIATAIGYPEKSRTAALEREISRDIAAEQQSDFLRAFGYSLPAKHRFIAPKNDTKNLWRSSRHVPKDLVTLKTVWEGITSLRSVKEYCRWMIKHPEYRRAPYLNSLGMFDPGVLEARLTYEPSSPLASPTEAPAPIDHIRRRLSELADTH